jgi:molecular chaperone DnaJ
MSKRCYYEVLGVKRTVDEEALKSAFRKLALKWHPDRNPGDASSEVRFKEINEAYEILKDPKKRAAYDRFGHAAFEQGSVGSSSDFAPGYGPTFSDLFESIFGMGSAGAASAKAGSDLRYNVQITLEEAFSGKTAELRLPTLVSCESCSGTGAKAGTRPKTCSECGGRGRVRFAQGLFSVEHTCEMCQGLGRTVEAACPTCSGSGRLQRERTLSVKIPAGIEDGACIRISGEGQSGTPGIRGGDLYVYLSIAPHRFFERDGADVYCRLPVSIVTAALGGEIEVPTIDGDKTRVKVPEGTQSGRELRLKGKGMPVFGSRAKGDMYVKVLVETPQNLNRRQREILAEFEKVSVSQAA